MNRRTGRRMWPALALALIAVFGVLGSLWFTDSGSAHTPAFSLTTTPSSRPVQLGGAVTFTVTVTGREGFHNVVGLSASGQPTGVTVSFSPSSVHPTRQEPNISAAISVQVAGNAAPGNYRIRVLGRDGRVEASTDIALAVVDQIVNAPGGGGGDNPAKRFTISGAPSGPLHPGTSMPVNLIITNPNEHALKVSRLTIAITGTGLTGCGTSNFAVTQYGGSYPLTISGKQSRSLQSLGVPATKYPRVTLLNLATNQDDCKGATITLSYTGTGSGA